MTPSARSAQLVREPRPASLRRHPPRVHELEAIHQATALLAAQTDPDETAVATVCLCGELLEAHRALLWWLNGDHLVPRAQWRDGAAWSFEDELAGAGPRHGLSAVRTEVESDGSLLIPLRADGEPVGVIVAEPEPRAVFDTADAAQADLLAAVAGPALRTARRLHDAEATVARLRDVDHVKTEFLALASHELRTPITVLTGYLSLLEDGAFGEMPAASRDIMPVINARLAEMEGLINAMLETARVEDGRLHLEIDAWDLREICDEAVRRCDVFVHTSQQLGLLCPETPVPVLVDRERLLTVISNIVHNAIKYSPSHTDVHCTVAIEGDTAAVAVKDSGLGIALEDMNTLFTRFGRIRRDPATHSIMGTGLGLYLSRELARAHGGDIRVESSPGAGSTFTVVVPLAT
ncbi:MAG: HAMP domain-containing histidine kinase [Candidatus Dormibacteraeota bacterium]|nr:HAMP domain-containing histidine kinase [Candidatus Dormibacteraeota bacterium]